MPENSYLVDMTGAVDFAPASELAEVLQNVRTIIATPRGTVVLDRDFGVSWHFLDLPHIKARAEATTEIIAQVARYEPRAKVTKIDWREDPAQAMDGKLRPEVRIDVIFTESQ